MLSSPFGRWADCVVPVPVKPMPVEPDRRHLRVRDGHAAGIVAAIDLGPDAQSGATVRGADQAHDGGEVDQWRPAPVHRDVGEEAMFDPVPLARTRREVAHRDREARAIGESLQLLLPEAESRAVAPARVGCDQQRPGLGIGRPPHQRRIAWAAKLAVS